jgi:uncharacterized OB-fold protein
VSNAAPDWTDGTERLVIELCGRCGRRWYFRRERCPHCGSGETTRHASTGRGMVAAVTTVHTGEQPFAVCLVDLDDGVRVMGRCENSLEPTTVVIVAFADGVPYFVCA